MEKISTNTEGTGRMSDVALARNLVAEIAGHCWRGKGDMLDRVYDAIEEYFRNENQPHSWTRRRVRSFWHREAAGVRYHEMMELARVAAAEKAKRETYQEARRDHAEFISRIGATLDRLAVSDAEFHRQHMEALRGMALQSADPTIGDAEGQGYQNFASRRSAGATAETGNRVGHQ